MEALDVAVVWDAAIAAPQNPSKVTNIFESQGIMMAQVEAHTNLVWATKEHVEAANKTPNYFKIFGVLLWNSLDLKYQLKLLSKESLFTKEGNHNKLLLWHHIVERVNPLMKVMVANFKEKTEGATLDNFGHDIKKFNLWFKDKRMMIVKEIETVG
eukprot:14120663-Ditylum_brightwellii.AAC.1